MTREEYEKTYIRMMDSIRTNCKGSKNCNDVDCNRCPIEDACSRGSLAFNAFTIMETVEKWGKEHPLVTRADKFEEVFGYMPNDPVYDNYPCPNAIGADLHSCKSKTCANCKKEYWESEYVEPKKEGKEE